MKKLVYIAIFILPFFACNSGPDCRTCTGTVTSSGDMGDWTVCVEDGTLTQTNNITGESMVTNNTLPESVAFFISIGMTCE